MFAQRLLERSIQAILCFSDGNSHNRSIYLFGCRVHRSSYIFQDFSLFYIPSHLPHFHSSDYFQAATALTWSYLFPQYEEIVKASSRRIID